MWGDVTGITGNKLITKSTGENKYPIDLFYYTSIQVDFSQKPYGCKFYPSQHMFQKKFSHTQK